LKLYGENRQLRKRTKHLWALWICTCFFFTVLFLNTDRYPIVHMRIRTLQQSQDSLAAQLFYLKAEQVQLYRYVTRELPTLEEYADTLYALGYLISVE
jgi:hypothetical protein